MVIVGMIRFHERFPPFPPNSRIAGARVTFKILKTAKKTIFHFRRKKHRINKGEWGNLTFITRPCHENDGLHFIQISTVKTSIK